MYPDDESYNNTSANDISDEGNESSPLYMEESDIEETYQNERTSSYESVKYQAEEQKNRSVETNKKVAKTAVQAVATAYGGPSAGKAVKAINDSGLADHNYERIANTLERQSRINPALHKLQEKLNEADDEGLIDAAEGAIGALGGDPSALASSPGSTGASANAPTPNPNGAVPANTDSQNMKAAKAINSVQNKKRKSKGKSSKENPIIKKITENPMIIVIILLSLGGIVLFVILLSLLLGSGAADESSSFLDSEYDFTNTKVILTNSYSDEAEKVVLQEMMFEDLIKGATYAEFYNSISSLTGTGKENAFKAFMIVASSIALSKGGYNSDTKEIEIKSGSSGLPYCDTMMGCKVLNVGGANTYVTSSYSGSFTGQTVSEIPEAPSDVVSALNKAYGEVKYLLLTPEDVNEAITSYTYGAPPYTQSVKEKWLSIANNSSYENLITAAGIYNNYKIYDIRTYASEYTYASDTAYWWPIGSSSADSNGLYSGKPTAKGITSPFGYRTYPNVGFHSGIDIGAGCGSNVIATRSGTVKKAQFNKSCGNFILIDHKDGTQSKYCHIANGGLLVKAGDEVRQGQLIAKSGTTGYSTGCHLHFEIQKNGTAVNPLDYVSASNARPASEVRTTASAVKGNNNMQSVCLTLKKSGFSDAAVAGIMTNMHHESGFRLTALGDSGTSYGLCQWHNGRYTKLKNYCGSKIDTVDCQLEYFLRELQSSYRGVYKYLRSNNSAWDMTN